MFNPFNTPLSFGVPREQGFTDETFAFPSTVVLDDPVYPAIIVDADGVVRESSHRSITGELFQNAQSPEYAGRYVPGFENDPGQPNVPSSTNPAPGSVDLSMARDTGGIGGTNRIIRAVGPVDGAGTDGGVSWSGKRDDLRKPNPNYAGPVTGGPDYAQQLGNAFYADQLAGINAIAASSAMVSAV